MADEVFGRDANRVPVVGGVTNDANLFVTALRVDPTSFRLLVDTSGLSTQIQDNDAVAAANYGTLILGTDGSNYQVPAVDSSGHFQVDVLSGGGGGTLVADNDAVNAANTGQIILGTDGSNYQVLATDASGNLQVDIVSGSSAGTEYTEDVATANPQVGSAVMIERDDQLAAVTPAEADWIGLRGTEKGALWVALADAAGDPITSFGGGTQYTEADTDASITGTAILWEDASDTLRAVSAAKPLPVEVTDASIAVTGTFWQVTQPVSGTVTANAGTNLNTSALATSAGQLADGHNVTVDNAVGAGVYVRPGTSAVFTVDLATNNDVTIDGSSIVHLEDVAHSTGDAGIMALGVENEDQADLSTGDKDYTPIAVTKEGNVIVKQEGTITVTESSPLSGFATSAKQLADGHNVTVDNAAGAAAVNIQDGGNTITVDGAVTTSGTVALTNDSLIGAGDPTIDSYAHVAINLNAGANQVLVSSAASKQIWVYGITYTCSVAGTVSFQDEDDTAITGIMDHAANSGLSHPTSGNFAMPIWKLGTDKDLEVDVVTAAIDGWLDYAIVSV